jgi:hypothetical protein
MALRLRTNIGLSAAAVLGVLAAVAEVVPYAVDVEAYKPGLIEAVRQATGGELVIDGPTRLSMFPVPGIGAGRVHFSNAAGAKGAQRVDVPWVSIRPAWSALLRGRVEIGTLTLYGPTIVLEAGAAPAAGAPSAGLPLAVGQLSIVRGTVRYITPHTGKTLTATDIHAAASVGSFDGPITLAGSAIVNGVPVTLDFKVGGPTGEGHDTSLSLQFPSGTLDFTGQLGAIDPAARMSGHLSVATGLLTDFISSAVAAIGGDKPDFGAAVAGRFSFDGGIEVAPDRLAISDFQMTMGLESASGSLALDRTPSPMLSGHVALAKLDLDKWLAFLSKPGAFSLLAGSGSAKPATAASPSALPADFNAKVILDIAEAAYRQGVIRDLSMAVEVAKGAIAVPRFKAVLPGDMAVQVTAAATGGAVTSRPGGDFSLAGPRLRDTLAWLGVETGRIPAIKLQTFRVGGRLLSTASGLQLSGATFELDGAAGTGRASLSFAAPLAGSFSVEMDRFDLDAYMPAPAAVVLVPPVTSGTAAAPAQAGPSASMELKAKVAKLVYRGETLNGVEGDMTVQGSLLKVTSLKVGNLLGAKFDLHGSVRDFATRPRFDLAFNANAPDTDRLLAYAELPKFRNGKIGAATASGSVAGTFETFRLRDVAVGFLGVNGRASGTLQLGNAMAFDFPSFSLQTPDASRLMSVASGRSMNNVGPVSVAGSFKGTPARATFTGDLEARGTKLIGTLEATLGARPRIVATLKVPGTLDIDHWLGVSAHPVPSGPPPPAAGLPPLPKAGVATAMPIDLGALRSFDASLSLFTSTTSIASLKINYADFDATLRNGVLKVSKLTGQFYGGAVDFTGTVDATGAALGLDFNGRLEGIYLGELLRGTVGDNNFGNPDLTLAIDGKLNALGIRLAGRGRSFEEIRNAMTGSATLSGYIYPSVIKGSRSLALLATGVAGIFSDSMAFNSLMLESFVDRQSMLAGPLEIGGGLVTMQTPTVQGDNATAHVTSRTSLAEEITDTLIAIFTGDKSGKASFVAKIKGPLSAPSFTTVRGGSN